MSDSEEEGVRGYGYASSRSTPTRLLRTYPFEIRVKIPKFCEDFEVEALRWGCRDATIKITHGIATLSFERRATDLSDAILSALENLTPVERYIASIHSSERSLEERA